MQSDHGGSIVMPGEDRQSTPVRAPRLGKLAHPPLAGFFGEVQETPHLDLDHKVARGPNILSHLRKEKVDLGGHAADPLDPDRSEEHTSELQYLMRITYPDLFLKKKNN